MFFKEEDKFFLQYFYELSPSDRLKALAALQKRINKDFLKEIKLKSMRTKDLLDISQLERLRKM